MIKQTPFVITISRQLGSGGSYLGQKLASRFGILYADRDILRQAAKSLNVSSEVAEPSDEKVTPVWLSLLRSFEKGQPELCYVPPANLPPNDDEFHIAESSVIRQIAKSWSSVIIGRGGYHLLRGNPWHFAVFLHADVDFRSKRIQEIHGSSPESAIKLVEKNDQDRKRYHRIVFGSDWTDTRQYHLSIDTSSIGFDTAEEIIADSVLAKLNV